MAPEGKRRRKRIGKLSCFFDKRVKPKNLEKVKPFREKNTTEINEVKLSVRKEGQKHCENLEVEGKIYIEKHSG